MFVNRQRLLAKLQGRLGVAEPGAAGGSVQDSPSPPDSSTNVGQGPSSGGSLSSSSRHGITVDIPEVSLDF